MSAHAISSGTVSFGLVTIPIKLYSTEDSSSSVSFNMLHKKCGSRVKQQYICPLDNEVVPKSDMVKGHEYSKGQYVLFTEEELAALTPKATNAIEIAEFVPLVKVDPIYFEKSFYLGPDKGGDRAYRLLSRAMKESGRAAIARHSARGKEYLVLLRPFEEGLLMQQLRYADELKAFHEVPVGDAETRPEELTLARQLIEQITSERFRPEIYQDKVRHQILALIEQKVQGKELQPAPPEAPKAQIIDLMAALKASLASTPPATAKKAEPAPAIQPAASAGTQAPPDNVQQIAARKPPRRSPKKPAETGVAQVGEAQVASGSGS